MAAGDVDATLTTIRGFRGCFFDGVDDKVQLPAGVNLTNDSFTISFWIWIPVIADADNERIIRHCDSGPNSGLNILFAASPNRDKVNMQLFNGATSTTSALVSNTLSMRTWYHIACTYNKLTSTAIIYQDGVAVGTDASAVMTPITTQPMFIGSSGTNQFSNCVVANLLMYKRELTQAEITKLAAGNKVAQGLEHEYQFNGNYTDSVTGTNGTATGTTLMIPSDLLGAAVAAMRTTANDKWLAIEGVKGQVMVTNTEEAP